MFRSFRIMALSIIPNVIPIVWTGGLMGALGIDLSTGTTMIASVVIGIAVDDTIHYLTRFRREQWRGTPEAVRTTTTGTGRALVISSVVLVIGFWVGALGSFKPTIYFSLLTGITMISALFCDLLVLPASLLLWDPARREAAA
jgi:predicted RND superfamily exporter protein